MALRALVSPDPIVIPCWKGDEHPAPIGKRSGSGHNNSTMELDAALCGSSLKHHGNGCRAVMKCMQSCAGSTQASLSSHDYISLLFFRHHKSDASQNCKQHPMLHPRKSRTRPRASREKPADAAPPATQPRGGGARSHSPRVGPTAHSLCRRISPL